MNEQDPPLAIQLLQDRLTDIGFESDFATKKIREASEAIERYKTKLGALDSTRAELKAAIAKLRAP